MDKSPLAPPARVGEARIRRALDLPTLMMAAVLFTAIVTALAAGSLAITARPAAARGIDPRVTVSKQAAAWSGVPAQAPAPPVIEAERSEAVVDADPAQIAAVAPPAVDAPEAGSAPPSDPTPQASPAPQATPTPPRPQESAYLASPSLEREHKVLPGETIASIAQLYGLKPETLLINNAGLSNRDLLKVGQKLQVPPRDGLLYALRYGETIETVARRYNVETQAVVGEPVNQLQSADTVRVGQVLFLPGVTISAPAPLPTPVPSPTPLLTPAPVVALTPAPTIPPRPAQIAGPVATAAPQDVRLSRPAVPAPTPAPAPRASSAAFAWPIIGPISSYFGAGHPLGIDIDLYGRAGSPVLASRAGTVTFSGGNPAVSYGYYVDIDHGDGYKTRYAHFQSWPPVTFGQRVEQGQTVGFAGTTGYSTGVHLHFEVLLNGAPVNPLALMPR